jgi:hypothetical protein
MQREDDRQTEQANSQNSHRLLTTVPHRLMDNPEPAYFSSSVNTSDQPYNRYHKMQMADGTSVFGSFAEVPLCALVDPKARDLREKSE